MEYVERVKGQKEADLRESLVQISSSLPSPIPVISGLLFGVLVEPEYSSPYLRTIGAITKESYAGSVELLKKLSADRFPRLLDSVRGQLIWIISTLIQLNVNDMEQLFILLLRNVIIGNVTKSNLALLDELLKLSMSCRDWLYARHPLTIASLAYSVALLIPDHHKPENEALRERETSLLVLLFRERFDAVKLAGRDMIRALYNISLIPDIKAIWEQIIMIEAKSSETGGNNSALSSNSASSTSSSSVTNNLMSTYLKQMLSTQTPKVVLTSRVTPELESWLTFIFTNVKNGQQVHYQKWLGAKYLATPENETLVPELIRWIVGVHHPTNAILQSNIVPRYKVLGWLVGQLRTTHIQSNARLSLFYDWLFYSPINKDNIMNIEPAALLMMHTIAKEPAFVSSLAEALMISTDNYLVREAPQMRDESRKCVHAASQLMLNKKVVSTFEPLLTSSHLPAPLRDALRKVFENVYAKRAPSNEPTSTKAAQETPAKSDSSAAHPTPSPATSQHIPVPQASEAPTNVVYPASTAPSTTNEASSKVSTSTAPQATAATSTPNSSSASSSTKSTTGTSNSKSSTKPTAESSSSSATSTPASPASTSTTASNSNATTAADSISPSSSSSSLFQQMSSPPPKSSSSPRTDDNSVFDGWAAALSKSDSGNMNFGSSAMDLDLPGSSIHQSSEIVLTPLQLSKYADSIAIIASKAESGAVKEARKELKSFLTTLALEPSSSDSSSSEVIEMASKLHESLTSEYAAMRMRGDDGFFGFSYFSKLSDVIHTQFFESWAEFVAEPKKYTKGMENLLALFNELRKLETKFGSRMIWFLFASNLPHLINHTDSEDTPRFSTTQEDSFASLLALEEEMTREEKRASKGLENARFMKPYLQFATWQSKHSSKNLKDIFFEDMTALAQWQAQTFNRVASLSLRYLPDCCVGSVPFVGLFVRTCLPYDGLLLQSSLSAQTITLCGNNLNAILRASLQWESYAQLSFWNALTSEYMFTTEPLIDALIELLPTLADSKYCAEALQGSLQLISLIGPIPKLIQAVLSMDIRTYSYSTAAFMRWMVEDEFQAELAKSLPTIFANLSKLDTQLEKAAAKRSASSSTSERSSETSSSAPTHHNEPFQHHGENFCVNRALMHLTLAYCVIPGDLDLLFDHAPLRKHLLNLLKTKCADPSFQSLLSSLQEKEEKDQSDKSGVDSKTRSSKKRAHGATEEAADDEEGDNTPKATAPPRAKRKKE